MDALGECTEDWSDWIYFLVVALQYFFGQGKYGEAAPCLNECLEKRKSILGENDSQNLDSINDWAILLYITNRGK
jgi:hypothetical protein